MKKKLLLLVVMVSALVCLLALTSYAATVTIYSGADSTTQATVHQTSQITLTGNTEANETVTVYFTDDGRAWKAGETVTFTEDTNLYTIECTKISTGAEWNAAPNGNYILVNHLDFNYEIPKADGSGGQGSGTRNNAGGSMELAQGSTTRVFFNGYTIANGNAIMFTGTDVSIYLLGTGKINSYWGGKIFNLKFTADADSTILVGKNIVANSDWTNKVAFIGINEYKATSKLDIHFYGSFTKGHFISQNQTPTTGSYNVYLHEGCDLNLPNANDGGRFIATATTPIANVFIDGGTYTFPRENLFADNAEFSRFQMTISAGTFNFGYASTMTLFKNSIDQESKAQDLSATSFKVVCKECDYELVLGENFENLGKDFTIDSYCPNCGARVSKEVPAVFTPLGYSIRENGGYGIFYGYEINQESLAEYQAYLEANNKSATFGVLIANAANFGTNSFISSDGTLGTTSGIKVDMSLDCKIVNCYINGFTKDEVDLNLVMAIYTIEDGTVTYVQKDGTYAGEVTQGGVTLNVVTFRKIAELVGRTDIDIIVPIEPKDEQE